MVHVPLELVLHRPELQVKGEIKTGLDYNSVCVITAHLWFSFQKE